MRRTLPLLVLAAIAMLLLWGCDHDTSNGTDPVDPGTDPVATDKTCLGCHSEKAELLLALGDEAGSKVLVPNKGDG
jgi:hypothetical protein